MRPSVPPLRLAFMGTPEFAVPALNALVAAGHDIACVYSQPPRPAGRGHREQKSPVHIRAEELGLMVRTPVSLKAEAEQAAFSALALNAAVVVAYGLLLPAPILQSPQMGCFNIHASLLPRWRGAAPIQRAIMAGDQESGVTIMQMDEGLDTGPIILTKHLALDAAMTGGRLHDALSGIGSRLIVEALEGLVCQRLKPVSQPETGVCYAAKLNRDDGYLDWKQPAVVLERIVRALSPAPSAWFWYQGERFKVLEAVVEAAPAQMPAPGTCIDDAVGVACGDSVLRIKRLQRPGKGPMDADAFLRGFALPAGTVLA